MATRQNAPVLLELFSGTGSIGRAFRARGWNVVSVDIDETTNPTIQKDVLELSPEDLPDRVDLIWASPPCTHYSVARTKAKIPRDLDGSDRLVRKVLDLVEHFRVDFLMENPYTGLLKTRDVVKDVPFHIVDYCTYGAPYRKRTAIWTNTEWKPRHPLCKHDCPSSVGRKHKARAQQGSPGPRFALNELYAVPTELCDELADFMT